MMDSNKTAIILIGFQNDYFLAEGILHSALESTKAVQQVLDNTVQLIDRLKDTPVLIINTPIVFTDDYAELSDPVGILQIIKEAGAFREGSSGSEIVSEFSPYQNRIIELPGKRGLNAFSNTKLDELLQQHQIDDVVIAGIATSICIDTTGRTALDKNYRVTILEDCTGGRSEVEQNFYCQEIFPLYANVISSRQLFDG